MIEKLKSKFEEIEDLGQVEEYEECGIVEGSVPGTTVAAFHFSAILEPSQEILQTATTKNELFPAPVPEGSPLKGATPPIDGEYFTFKRSYQMRESTVRMLHELKANHPDTNAYLNTIVDAALRYYHAHIFNIGEK